MTITPHLPVTTATLPPRSRHTDSTLASTFKQFFGRNFSLAYKPLISALCMAGLLAGPPAAAQNDIVEACQEAGRLLAEENDIKGALEEAEWCVEGLQQLKQKQTLAVLPDKVGEFVGGETSNQQALGMSMIEREYTRDAQSIAVTLSGGGAAASGLAAIAQMGMSMGAQGGTKIRVQRRTVVDIK